jgi:triosephosphate isomerase
MAPLIVANWKMQLTHRESLQWLSTHSSSLNDTLTTTDATLVICPSYTVLPCMKDYGSHLEYGAQNCAFVDRGAYTGDISALTLKELGCSYAIIGHSEQRKYYGETNEHVAQKAHLLASLGIQPIICIGEESVNSSYEQAFNEQLDFLTTMRTTLIIAYEPIWAIGTGQHPSAEKLSQVTQYLYSFALNHGVQITVLYGGSVDEHLVTSYKGLVDGFLIGKASLDAELLKKIILSC